MEEKKIKLKRERKKFSLKRLMADKKKRYLIMLGMMVPFIVAIAIFGSIAYREAKNLIDLAKGNTAETKAENIVESMNYILRDNPTDLQKEYFRQLKKAVEEGLIETEEGDVPAEELNIAELVAKNYIADFYTWTNKRGQYDIGGFYYLYDGEYENGDHYKENLYFKARDGFYKYISSYGTQYGKENLIEVENVEITKSQKMNSKYMINEHVENRMDANGEWYDYREDHGYDAYLVSCKWNYKENTVLNMNQFANSLNLMIINKEGRFEIIEASEKTINVRTGSASNTEEEKTETAAAEETSQY